MRYNRGYTAIMKTAISIRDDIFEAAEQVALDMGISRSELYSKAVELFVARHENERVTERLDAVYGEAGSSSALDGTLVTLQTLSLPTDEEW